MHVWPLFLTAPLWAAGPDLLAFETIPCLLEAKAIAKALEAFALQCQGDGGGCTSGSLGSVKESVRAWVSFSCCSEDAACSGDAFVECVQAVSALPQVLLPFSSEHGFPPYFLCAKQLFPCFLLFRFHLSKYCVAPSSLNERLLQWE